MITSVRTGSITVVLLAFFGGFSSQAAYTAPPAKPDPKAVLDDRDEIDAKLLLRVTLKDPLKNVTLREALEFLTEKYDLTLLVDFKSFNGSGPAAVAMNVADDPILDLPINVPALKNVRIATILKHVVDQIDGVYLIYPDHIKIVSAARAYTLTKPAIKANGMIGDDAPLESGESLIRATPLVTASFSAKPLREVLKDVEMRTNRTIVLANQAASSAEISITARFANVPVEQAVATLAEMADLKLVAKGNVLLVTTAERAPEPEPPPAAPMMFGQGLFPADPNIVELKKKIADLEQKLAELTKEKK